MSVKGKIMQTTIISDFSSNSKSSRIASIDILRGLVMLIMLLDHVRERFFYHHQVSDPMVLSDVAPSLFFTRLAAHLCAPVFVFLTGLGAWLYAHPSGKAPRSPKSFLLNRGLFLVLLEITLVNFLWFGSFQTIYLQVIWAIGLSMIFLAFCSGMPRHLLGLFGLVIVFGHNALSFVEFSPGEWGYTSWAIFHDRGFLIDTDWLRIKASYPILPWMGVILCGYWMGPLFGKEVSQQKRISTLVYFGLGSFLVLAILRGTNSYGETLPWKVQESITLTVMDFLNFTKYPPSLDFILLTLGIGFLLLAGFEKNTWKPMEVLRIYGNAPMFFYILHLYVLLVLYTLFNSIFGPTQGKLFGFEHLWQVWTLAVILGFGLYFPTRWFGKLKRRSPYAILKYF